MHIVERLKREGIAVLLVEQNVASALAVADRCYVMDRGRIVHEGRARALLDDPALRVRLLGI
jgi:branched-chain amino acid transport system ATP-binding protein